MVSRGANVAVVDVVAALANVVHNKHRRDNRRVAHRPPKMRCKAIPMRPAHLRPKHRNHNHLRVRNKAAATNVDVAASSKVAARTIADRSKVAARTIADRSKVAARTIADSSKVAARMI